MSHISGSVDAPVGQHWDSVDQSSSGRGVQVYKVHSPNADLKLGQRLRRWPNIESALVQRFVSALKRSLTTTLTTAVITNPGSGCHW